MSKNKRLRILIFLSLLTAMSIVLTRFLAINFTPSMRMSFGNIPIVIASLTFGPVAGAAVGFIADFTGSALIQGGWLPFLSVMPVLMGILPWLFNKMIPLKNDNVRLTVSVVLSNVAANMLVGTFILSQSFGSPFLAMLPVKILIYGVVCIIESAVIVLLKKARIEEKIRKGTLNK